MRAIPLAILAAGAVALAVCSPSPTARPAPGLGEDAAAPTALPRLSALAATRFVPNRGQWHPTARFAVLGDTSAWLTDDGFSLRLERWSQEDERRPGRRCTGAVVRTRFVGATTEGFTTGEELGGRHHFLKGPVDRHVTDVPAFASVTMQQVHPGIDVHFRPLRAGAAGAFEYDLLLAAGADLSRFVAECDGVDCLRLDDRGRLVATVSTPDGRHELVQEAPVAWQIDGSGRRPVEIAFELLGTRRYGFRAVDVLDPDAATVVDPGVVWGSFLGGGATDRIHDIKWQPGQGIWAVGWSGSTDFPTTTGAFAETGGNDAFVVRMTDDGQALTFATYLGGSAQEQVRGVAVDGAQIATVVGFTNSLDFPTTTGAVQSAYAGASIFIEVGDAFVSRLSADGSALLASTYLGGSQDDVAEDVLLLPNGDAAVVGWTSSDDFPMPAGGFQPAFQGVPSAQSDGFVLAVAPSGQAMPFGTFLGGTASDQLLAVDLEATTGDLVVAGWTYSADYPTTTNVVRPTNAGGIDAIVTRLGANAATAVFSTYMGGADEDAAQTVKFATDGSVWIGGFTNSANYPVTASAPQQVAGGDYDGFLSRISVFGQTLLHSTWIGGGGNDRVRDLDLSQFGMMVVGEAGAGFPVTVGAPQTQFGSGSIDGFAALYDTAATTMSWASYFGGVGQDSLLAVEFEDNGLATAAGFSYSFDFPVAPIARQGQLFGAEDGVLLQFDLLTDLGEGLAVEPVSSPGDVRFVDHGEVDLLTFDLVNLTPRDLVVDALQLFVTGHGADASNVVGVQVLRDGAVVTTVGGLPAIQPCQEVPVVLNGLVLKGDTTTRMRVTATVQQTNPGTVEVAAAIVDKDAWQVRALGAGGGPSVAVLGLGRVTGPVYVAGQLPGDVDAD
ncbi:MAG TPA: hypothetical protein ENI87_04945, partial [bacterium]|nr:hypothetical protein [bacterium]